MKRIVTKIAALAAAATMTISMLPMNVMASANYTPVAGTTMTFNKYLIMDSQANVPNLEFAFTIEPGADIAAASGKVEVLAGSSANGVTGTPTISASGKAVFAPTDSKSSEVATGDTVTLEAGRSYVKKTLTVDFAGVTFPEPGIYRWILTETSAGQSGVSYDTQSIEHDKVRVLDVYIIDENGALGVGGYILHDRVGDVPAGNDFGSAGAGTDGATDAVADKLDGFVNELDTSDLSFKKEVSGNQASKDQYFAFTVAIGNMTEGDKLNVVLTNASPVTGSNKATLDAYENKTQPTELTIGADGSVTQVFYLNHGQSIKIEGLTKDATYSVTEDKEDYKSTPKALTGFTDETSGTIVSADINTSYLNTKAGVVNTGVIVSVVTPVAVVVACAIALIIFLIVRKKRAAQH